MLMRWVKFFAVVVVLAVAAGSLRLWYKTFLMTNYIANAGTFLVVVGVVAPIFVLVMGFYAIRGIVRFDASKL